MQSHTEVLNFLENNPEDICVSHKVPVLSIAPQCLASLAASISSSSTAAPVTLRQVLRRVEAFCKTVLGFKQVYDTTFARHIALLEHAKEFRERKAGVGQLPMLASACPGWVCYAEKTHAEMLPFISRTKSPQQVMGTLVKEWFGARWGKRQDFFNDVYSTRDIDCVITTGELDLMMRDKGWDLSKPVEGEDLEKDIGDTCHQNGDDIYLNDALPELVNHPGTSAGSYLHSLIANMVQNSPRPVDLDVKAMRSADYEEYTLTERESRTVIFRGAKCYGFRNLQNLVRKVGRDAGLQVGRGAAGKLAGLRGRGLKTRKGEVSAPEIYDYVEVMACPGGCINGGGQLRPPAITQNGGVDHEGFERDWQASGVQLDGEDIGRIQGQGAKWGDKEWTKKVELAYWQADQPHDSEDVQLPKVNGIKNKTTAVDHAALQILRDLCKPKDLAARSWLDSVDEEAETRRRKYFRTQYRAVESEVVGLAVKW
ncbi:hypothetical protein PHLCEN_2v7554 [Hermanssonia centrifuga]|uniref:Iron hydrogenase large subunit C-terminal domain-containing protein n=1 Tax=Hermanssonia centrifuga TaxID=98765 RepID=A0A2R6NW78_9APHY|nr:hypothetical protein PHLCEN_2v7554 [Hermanssonia centrifuga]